MKSVSRYSRAAFKLFVCLVFLCVIWRVTISNRISLADKEKPKLILNWADCFGSEDCRWGADDFFPSHNCAVNNCRVITDKSRIAEAEIVIFHINGIKDNGSSYDIPAIHDPNQIWVYFTHENPYNTHPRSILPGWNPKTFDGIFNATLSYMRHSDFFLPYFTYAYRRHLNKSGYTITIQAKKNKVLWFVSHCQADSRRMEYVNELKKYIEVDIFGMCGRKHPCGGNLNDQNCERKLVEEYKYYLAFENAKCRDYITEKFWRTLESNTVPIVLGAHIEDYTALAPPKSFIHVDEFESPAELARYLHHLNSNDTAYKIYLEWNKDFEVREGNEIFAHSHPHEPSIYSMCKMCEVAHNKRILPRKVVNLSDWFSVDRLCRST